MGQNLGDCNLAGANVSGADFSRANLINVGFDSGEYIGALLTTVGNAKFTNANLSGANFTGTDVSACDFTSAFVANASFNRIITGGTGVTGGGGPDPVKVGVGGLTVAQLYSTASYQNHDLEAIGLSYNDLTGIDLSGQNLFGASFEGAA